jgi:hypothetical protein
MDLRRNLAVIWRFRLIVGLGVIFATVFAMLAAFKPSTDGLEWRSSQKWTSTSTLFVTQTGFPWGRVTLPEPVLPGAVGPDTQPEEEDNDGKGKREFAAPERFVDLALLYSYLANSTEVRQMIKPRPTGAKVLINSILNPGTGSGLPLLNIEVTSASPEFAQRVNGGTIDALRRYLESQQDEWKIPSEQRVRIQTLNPPSRAQLTEGRSYMTAVIAFVLAIALTLGLVYLLENLYPRRRAYVVDEYAELLEPFQYPARVPPSGDQPEESRPTRVA